MPTGLEFLPNSKPVFARLSVLRWGKIKAVFWMLEMPIPFTTAEMPTGTNALTTVEEVNTWSAGILMFNYATNQYTEAANTNGLFHYIQPELRIPTGELIRVNRCAVIMDESKAQNLPLWKRVKGLSAITAIPAGFKI